MKQFLVIYQCDGESKNENGKRVTEILTIQERYVSESIQEVWEHIHNTWELAEGERTLITIHEEHSAIFTTKANQ